MIENQETKIEEVEETELSDKPEAIHFHWTIAIIIGVLIVLIIACFIVVMILGPVNPATSSSRIELVLHVKR